ncbi:MAG TPA: phosphatase PAP2 family protein [Candidatus Saccharimonadia bacterium]|nr:phosphatase PAP2 family protein [Candidatus Saccharimonadia bacterium]
MNSIIVFCASYLYLFVIIGIVIAWLKTTKNLKVQFIISTIIACAIAFIFSRIASKLYYDPRPFITEHVKPLIAHQTDNGFPSDHALLTGTLTAITYFYSKKVALGMLVLTVIIGIARVLAKVHSPLDIGAGWLFGVVGAVAGYYIVQYFWSKQKAKTKLSKS